MNRTRLGAALLSILVLSALPAAAQNAAREAQDRLEIEKLMWNYTRALDSANPEAYAAAYTPDGEFRAGGTAVKGTEALKKLIADFAKGNADAAAKGEKRPALYHMTTSSYLEFVDKDHARLEAYWITVRAGASLADPTTIAAAGREVDQIVRLNGKWLIQVRDVAPKD